MNTIKTFPSAHSIIHAAALEEIISKEYGLESNISCELLHRGMNDFYLIRSIDRFFVAQIWRPQTRIVENIISEMRFLEYLYNHGVNVPKPHKTLSGDWYLEVGSPEGIRLLGVFSYIEGKVFSKNPSPRISRELGEIFAKIHNLSEKLPKAKYNKYIDRGETIKKLMPSVEKLLFKRPKEMKFYTQVGNYLISFYKELNSDIKIRNGMTHGDFHIHNAFVAERGDVTIMDFDACGVDYYIQELMSYKWSIEKNNLPDNLWQEFLSGYNRYRNLSREEIEKIPGCLLGKEFSYLCGFAASVNAIGHVAFHFPGLDWFHESLKKHSKNLL